MGANSPAVQPPPGRFCRIWHSHGPSLRNRDSPRPADVYPVHETNPLAVFDGRVRPGVVHFPSFFSFKLATNPDWLEKTVDGPRGAHTHFQREIFSSDISSLHKSQ